MNEEKAAMFRNRLSKVFRHLGKLARKLKITCFRVYDHDIPEFPFCIDVYEDKLYVAEYARRYYMTEDGHQDWLADSMEIIASVTGITVENIFLKLRQRKQGRLGQYRQQDTRKAEFIANEQGLKFLVNLIDYLDTGLFLDHRLTRQMVRDQSMDKKVLNLFAYTGSFSVYAAAGGASEVITVDLSKTYLNWAQRNFELNDLKDETRYKFIHADVMKYIKELPENYFDMIILDPPTFSNSQRMEDILDIQRDHVSLINDCLKTLKESGELFFSTNFKKFSFEKQAIYASEILDITKKTTPFDFRAEDMRFCYLIKKSLKHYVTKTLSKVHKDDYL